MQASSPPKANKPQAPTHPHTTLNPQQKITLSPCQYAIPDNKGYINCVRGDSHIGLCQTPCPYGQLKNKWEWDKQTIQRYRETHEPYTDYEQLMLEKAQTNPYWLQIWQTQGKITKQTLPSGLTILTRRKQNIHEQYILTDTNEILDFISYKATSSASKQNCTTFVDKRVLSRVRRKKPKASFSAAFFEVVQNDKEAAGVE